MKSAQKHTRSSKKILIAAVAIIACGLVGVGAMALTHTGPFNKAPQSSAQPKSDTPTTPTTSNSGSSDSSSTPGKTPTPNEPTKSETPTNQLTASITAANQNGNTLQIRTLIEAVSSEGTCMLTLSKDSVFHDYSVGIQAQASASTCKGFNIPTSSLSAGTWKISIDIKINGKTAHLTKNITIN